MRINKFIAQNTEFSRRKADELVQSGQVFLNGKKVEQLGTLINPEKDKIEIKNYKFETKNSEKIYLALNKPSGYITTRKDEKSRQTIMDLIPENLNLKPAGRLDKDTEGLLLLSNDGDFINKLTHPKFETEKEYHVEITSFLTDQDILKLKQGIKIDNKITHPAKIKLINRSKKHCIVRITIHEGRNRQIRKMFDSLGHPVKYLQRVRIDKILLGSLPKGKFRHLSKSEIKNAYKLT